jgi:hypothetical protein
MMALRTSQDFRILSSGIILLNSDTRSPLRSTHVLRIIQNVSTTRIAAKNLL